MLIHNRSLARYRVEKTMNNRPTQTHNVLNSAMIEKPFESMMYADNWYLQCDYVYKSVKVNHACSPSVSNVDNQEVKCWYLSSIL